MDDKPDANAPVVRGVTAVKDISAVVDFILKRRSIPRLNLLGWSWGTTLMATYTTREPRQGRAPRALCAGVDPNDAIAVAGRPGPLGAYRAVAREQAQSRWLTGVPEDKKATLIPAGWFESWADATFATDPVGAKMTPRRCARRTACSRTATSSSRRANPITTRARSPCRPCSSMPSGTATRRPIWRRRLFPLLVNAPGKRYVQLPEGTHTIMMEKNRLMLFEAVQAFLDRIRKVVDAAEIIHPKVVAQR